MPKMVAIVLTISGDLYEDCVWSRSHCSLMFDVHAYFRFNVLLRTGQVSNLRVGKCDAT